MGKKGTVVDAHAKQSGKRTSHQRRTCKSKAGLSPWSRALGPRLQTESQKNGVANTRHQKGGGYRERKKRISPKKQ